MDIYTTHPFSITDEDDNLHILRGRPGSGKTTFLRQVEGAAKAKDLPLIGLKGGPTMLHTPEQDSAMHKLMGNIGCRAVFIDDACEADLDTARRWAKKYPAAEFFVAITQ